MLAAFALFLVRGNWVDAFSTLLIFGLMTAPAFFKERYHFYLPNELSVALVAFTFISLFLGSLADFYERFPWLDGTLHFLSGILFGLIGFVLIYALNERKSRRLYLSPSFVSLFAVCFSLALSVVWEIYEFVVDIVLGFHTQETGLFDTMGDLIINTVSSVLVALAGYLWMRRYRRLPLAPGRI